MCFLYIQKAHSHKSKSPVGQPPCHVKQVQCNQLIITQSQTHLFQQRITRSRTNADSRSLSICKYPAWVINRMKVKTSTPRNNNNNNKDNKPICKSYITVPYNEGLSETFKHICKRYGIQVHFKSGKTIKMSWWHLKIKTTSPRRVV